MTGHRALADPAAVAARADEALARIAAAHPNRRPTLLSALAEGADRLVARRALALPGTLLVALLPLPEARYVETFGADGSRAEYDELRVRAEGRIEVFDGPSFEAGLAELADRLVGLSDALIAVWDGRPARGPGGTAAVVERARAASRPLAWIRAERAGGAPGAELVWERFPPPSPAP